MAFESIPYGQPTGQNAMGIPVAFCNAIAFDLTDVKRLVYVSGQLATDEHNQLVGKGGKSLGAAVGRTVFDPKVLSFDIAQVAESLP